MTIAARVTWVLLWSGACLPLPAQAAAGNVRGFAGEPAVHATVRAVAADGETLADVVTDDTGAFELHAKAAIARLQVRIEGVLVEVAVAGGSAAGVAVTFAGVPHVTVHGHVVDPGGALARGCDVVARGSDGKAIVNVTTDDRGAFTLRTNQGVRDVLVDPLGWRHVEPGPLSAARGLPIDLRLVRDRFFCLRGRALDDAGRPANGWRLVANGERQRAATTIAAADGSFVLWSAQAIVSIEAHDTLPRMGRLGPWRADTELALDERHDALVLVSGRFLAANGEPLPGAMVFACFTEAPPEKGKPAIGGTDARGRFFVRVIPKTPFLFAVREGGDRTTPKGGDQLALTALRYDGAPIELRAR